MRATKERCRGRYTCCTIINIVAVNVPTIDNTDTTFENGIENGIQYCTAVRTLHTILCILCDVQEMKQKQDAERQWDLERKQAAVSGVELRRTLEELKRQIQVKDAQV